MIRKDLKSNQPVTNTRCYTERVWTSSGGAVKSVMSYTSYKNPCEKRSLPEEFTANKWPCLLWLFRCLFRAFCSSLTLQIYFNTSLYFSCSHSQLYFSLFLHFNSTVCQFLPVPEHIMWQGQIVSLVGFS